jgi:hypothetical protein
LATANSIRVSEEKLSFPAICGNMKIKSKVIGYMIADIITALIVLKMKQEGKYEFHSRKNGKDRRKMGKSNPKRCGSEKST